ncbi:unnamed protein product [Callosobruchus maculatus]|uniref:Uncharacterized protein n=1 Tax=Callosobruchus maculatus TaxID=64391 RepID=A0A653BFZ2_CALMS|nr:unnamed protein product [Callosobruchus maculatus]
MSMTVPHHTSSYTRRLALVEPWQHPRPLPGLPEHLRVQFPHPRSHPQLVHHLQRERKQPRTETHLILHPKHRLLHRHIAVLLHTDPCEKQVGHHGENHLRRAQTTDPDDVSTAAASSEQLEAQLAAQEEEACRSASGVGERYH